tara:strand:- start:29 stop:625 length:597 start_codon:yes stop_codon:yes gene_type:complete
MKQLTDDQWRYYEQRYGKLMKMISSRISGDEALANPEDNYSDLCIAALESIEGFRKKTGESFDVAMNNKLFDQYTKTVLWNRKAKKGIPLTNKMPFRNKHFSIDQMKTSGGEHNSFDLEDPKASLDLSSMFLEETFGHANPDVKVIVNAIVKDPSVVTEEGKLKNASLRNTTGLSLYRISKAVNSIKMLSNNDKEYDA